MADRSGSILQQLMQRRREVESGELAGESFDRGSNQSSVNEATSSVTTPAMRARRIMELEDELKRIRRSPSNRVRQLENVILRGIQKLRGTSQ